MRKALALLILLTFTSSAYAWNALGHKVIAEIAWEQLKPEQQKGIADILRRHPRFDEDFAKKIPSGVEEDRWIFQQAATWPDMIRGEKQYDHPTWHYVNFPYYADSQSAPFGLNLSAQYPTQLDADKWNVAQAVKHCQATLNTPAPPADKALAYCWLLHLVGDIHQPLHSTTLVSARFPKGDKGGNSIPTVQAKNLHSFWDGLLGRGTKPNDVKREVAKLYQQQQQIWNVEAKTPLEHWIKESHEACKSFVYSPQILQAVEQPGELQPINLPPEYLEGAGQLARARVVAAGLRLGQLLSTPEPTGGAPADEESNSLSGQEKHGGWKLLFDGQSTAGWMTVKGDPLAARHVQDGSLNPHPCDYMLVYREPLENYLLSLDFKISPKCNSGVFIRTFPLTPRPGKDVGFNGIEIAIDDTQTAGLHDTGAIYDLVPPSVNAMKPVGQWNHLLITSDRNHLAVKLNGKKVSTMDLDQWTEPNKRPDGSAHKFDVAYKAHPRQGYIGLQDHGSDCWFRNIKFKPLP